MSTALISLLAMLTETSATQAKPYVAPYVHECLVGSLTSALDAYRLNTETLPDPNWVPKWKDIETLDRLISAVQVELLAAKKGGHLADTQAMLRGLDIKLEHLTAGLSPVDAPTARELRRKYLAKVEYVLRLTGAPRSRELPRLGSSGRKARILEAGKSLVKQAEEQWKDVFPTTGFESHEAFRTHLQNYGSEVEALRELREGRLVPAMYRPVQGRWWISKVGFHNQHVTGSSGGFLGSAGRNRVEATRIGMDGALYSPLDSEIKPVYGALQRKPVAGMHFRKELHYGEDFYVFKESRIRDRTTYTIGDSLNTLSGPLGKVYYQSEGAFKPHHWDQVFIPWKEIEFSTPFLDVSSSSHIEIRSSEELLGHKYSRACRPDRSYLELQFWGGLGLADVETFVFSEPAPAGDFLRELKRHRIEILRYDPYYGSILHPWTPQEARP